MGKTGGGPANYMQLSDMEKRLLNLMGTKAVEGDHVQEMGFGQVLLLQKSFFHFFLFFILGDSNYQSRK